VTTAAGLSGGVHYENSMEEDMSGLFNGAILGNTLGSVGYASAEVTSDSDPWSHPLYKAFRADASTLEVIRKLMDDVLKNMPDTNAKAVAIQHLHTASMWLDMARNEGEQALRKAIEIDMQARRRREEQEKARAYEQVLKPRMDYSQDEPVAAEATEGSGAKQRTTTVVKPKVAP
jgi:hypothetical protein